MVISKSKVAVTPEPGPGIPMLPMTNWHNADGKLSVKGKKLKDRILECIDAADGQIGYTEIQEYLIKEYPSDYVKVVERRNLTVDNCFKNEDVDEAQVSVQDIKILVGELVKEDKVVDS